MQDNKAKRLQMIIEADKVVVARIAASKRDKLVEGIIRQYDNGSLDSLDPDKDLFGSVKIKMTESDQEQHDEWILATK